MIDDNGDPLNPASDAYDRGLDYDPLHDGCRTFVECDAPMVCCQACSRAGGADMPVYHAPPECYDDDPCQTVRTTDPA